MKRGHKIVSLLIACAMVTPLAFSNVNTVEAANKFEGQETKYYKLCSSKTLTRSNQNTCKEFNKYLKTKSASLKSEISSKQSSVDSAKLSISDAADKINSLNSQINEATQKIAYMNTAITNAENNLNEKKALLKDRIYSMQSQMNSNAYVDYLFNASSFSDFFSRAATLKDLTSYETDLMNEIKEEQKQLEIQKQTALNAQKSQAEELQKSLVAKLEAEQKALQDKQSDLSDNESNIGTIAQNLVELSKASDESKVSGVTHATPNKNNSSSSNSGSSNNGGSSNNSGSSNNGGGNTIPTPTPSPDQSSRGLAIANKALTRQGYMYSWGGCHSMSQIANPNWTKFDCSGLVNWAHYQAGVNIGSNTTKTLCGVGTQVDRGSMQAGDIILFSSNGSYSGVHHVGIYIGGNRMVHAPSSGKPVQVATLGNGYWQREFYQARRCY